MPKKGYKKPEQTVLLSPSPPKNRSSFVRKTVRWSPQVELQDAINTANVNLDRMPLNEHQLQKLFLHQLLMKRHVILLILTEGLMMRLLLAAF